MRKWPARDSLFPFMPFRPPFFSAPVAHRAIFRFQVGQSAPHRFWIDAKQAGYMPDTAGVVFTDSIAAYSA
ncbi:MAG: hypothetical protein PHR16_13870 [Methylovulum sp.]|nr:hypothetical protein [Methylovulum sp.]